MMRKLLEAVLGIMDVFEEAEEPVQAEMFKAPEQVDTYRPTVFLAGTIDMGDSVDWQKQVYEALIDQEVAFLNPRRDKWDASWEQDISNPQFKGQVDWELDWQEEADFIVMYFAPESKAPITLLELGIAAAGYPEKVVVACPEGYWRRGNVQIVCDRFGIELVDSLEEMIVSLKEMLN